ncbi:MAG: SURF1 family protein [Chloroflexi bacterium]|nr:SURF1 family protein [Chloroflexota bacterium]
MRYAIRAQGWTTLVVLAACAVLIGLGVWQLQRLAQRRAFNARVMQQLDAPPIMLNSDLTELASRSARGLEALSGLEYRAVVVRGEYDQSQEVVLKNQTWQEQRGVHLITPLRIAGSDHAVLVDRGWIPEAEAGTDQHGKFAEPGMIEVRGYIRQSQSPRLATAAVNERQDAWFRVDTAALQAQVSFPLLPFYIQAVPELAANGRGVGATDPASARLPYRVPLDLELTEGKHLGYALTWFVLAAALALGYVRLIWKQLPRPLAVTATALFI